MKIHLRPCLFLASLAAFAPMPEAAGTLLFNENFENQTLGQQPTGFDQVRPLSGNVVPYGETNAVNAEITEGLNGRALHLFSYNDSQSALVEKNFAAGASEQFSRIRFDATVQPFADPGTGADANDALILSLLSYNTSMSVTSLANRAMDVRFRHNGQLTIRSGSPGTNGTTATFAHFAYDPDVPNTVSIFANSSEDPVLYAGADGETHLLDALSFAVYLNNSPVREQNFEFQGAFFHDNVETLGKLGILTGTATTRVGMDFLVDDIGVSTYEVIPEPSTYALITGMVLLGLAFMRRRR